MSTAEVLVESVKAAISGGNATSSTVTTLQSLLSSAPGAPGKPSTASHDTRIERTTARIARPAKTTRTAPKSSKKDQTFKVLEDEPRGLAPKARYALATEVVNITLKVLTDASKQPPRKHERHSSVQIQSTPRRPSMTPASQRALQIRSGNETPVVQSPTKQSGPRRRPSQCSVSGQSTSPDHLIPTGECARLGFAYLRSIDFQKLGLREPPKLQLETGMLALCGKLIALELSSLAAKELRAVKKRLESVLPSKRTTKPAASTGQQTGESETLPSLLQLNIDLGACSGARPLVVNLQLYVLQLIAAAPKPKSIEDVLQFLESGSPESPTKLLLRLAADGGDRVKVSKQLATLSRTILQLCPNVASSSDEVAKDPSRSPSPLTCFRLQTISLDLRRETWKLDNRIFDAQKDLVDPLSRCLAALVRRMPAQKGNSGVFAACQRAYETLEISSFSASEPSNARFTIYRTLSVFAGRDSLPKEALLFSEKALADCKSLGEGHARFVAALARKTSVTSSDLPAASTMHDLCADLDIICESLQKSLSGSASDYEMLFAELADMVTKSHTAFEAEQLRTFYKRLTGCVAGFASSYVRSFPGKNFDIAQEVIQIALSQSGSNEALLSWVTKDTAQVFVQSGVLRRVVDKLSSRSLELVWASFSSAMAFARVLRLIVLKAAAAHSSDLTKLIVDDKNLNDDERGALIEWQLKCALDLGHKSKYQAGLKSLLPEYFRRLSAIYAAECFPLRRARVAIQAYGMREQFPELIAPHHLAAFVSVPITIDDGNLGHDHGLAAYAPSLRTSLEIAAAFYSGQPALDDLSSSLLSCENHLMKIKDAAVLDHSIDNPNLLCAQLNSLHDYLEMFGDDASRLRVAKLLCRFGQAGISGSLGRGDAVVRLSRTYISLAYAEKAGEALSEAQKTLKSDEPSVEALELLLCRAEYMLAMQDFSSCHQVIEVINHTRQQLQDKTPRSLQTSRFRMLLGRAWLLVSQWLFESGSAHDSLSAAKRAVKIMNSIWSGLERSGQGLDSRAADCEPRKEEASVANLTNKVSKLVLKPDAVSPCQKKSQFKGASFWPVAGLLCRTLVHLADVYAHHGVFNEANYSSEQAVTFAESIGSSHMLSRVRYHRSILLTAAGRLEEAELCLAHDPNEDAAVPPLVRIESLRAKAALSEKIGDLAEARSFYLQAESTVKELQSETYLACEERALEPVCHLQTGTTTKAEPRRQPAIDPSRNKKTTTQSRQKLATGRTAPATKRGANSGLATANERSTSPKVRMLERLEAVILLDKALVSLNLGQPDSESMNRLNDLAALPLGSFKSRRLGHESIMQKVYSELQADFSFNVLPESTLSFPALQDLDRRLSAIGTKGSLNSSSTTNVPARPVKRGKASKPAAKSTQSLGDMLSTARHCIAPECSADASLSTTETHKQFSLMANTSMMLSATSASHAMEILHPMQEALAIDHGRIYASGCYSFVAKMDKEARASLDPLAWPESAVQHPACSVSARTFRDQYVDLLPSSWTAVSMSLSETCDELYLTRYRRSQPPLVIRLPFSRQKTDEADDEVFDFNMGKEELKEIIELSNYSCHNSLDTNAKGAKTNWWNEREALDRRLHELLINIENIWLGGFKGVLSQHAREKNQLDRFRKSFESVMDRHLPSRKSIKKGSKKLTLDDQVLELFVGLGSDQDGEIDLDESLADLLYFIVDILQFNGERNAYDEIDFDSMAIDILDALRTYHDSIEEQEHQHPHLILVLDKRLQAFPWESLPCLEKCSVSRVDSMLTLRDRLAEMRRQPRSDDDHYMVSRRSGSYILNPSSDLKGTETTLGPALSKLAASNGCGWSSTVGIAPSEDDFRHRLSNSSMLLYFGHGAGSQYIGQRQIRRLDRCSEVVWLMGCSSGAVTEYDELEPVAVPLAYLVAGQTTSEDGAEQPDRSRCMAVVSTLWDVTDKDIDRFSLAVGEEWGLWRSEQESTKLPAKTPRKREKLAAPSTPERTAKTPKTPKVKKTPAPARTPARSRSRPRGGEDRKQSLVEAVAKSRDACYLRYLNGAAPVVYGVPVYLGD